MSLLLNLNSELLSIHFLRALILLSLKTNIETVSEISLLNVKSTKIFDIFVHQFVLLISFGLLDNIKATLIIQMKSQAQWRLKYVQTSSECGSDNEQSQLRHQLHRQEIATRQASLLADHYKSLNENLQKSIDKLTADCSQLAKCDGHCLQSQSQNAIQQLQQRLQTEVSKFSNLLKTYQENQKLLSKLRFQSRSKDSQIQQLQEQLSNSKLMSQSEITTLRLQLSSLSSATQQITKKYSCLSQQLQQSRRKHLQNYDELIRQRTALKKELEEIIKENLELRQLNQELKRSQRGSEKELTWCAINSKLMGEIGKLQDKLAAKEREGTATNRELAEIQVKMDRYETALRNSDRKIAELQGMLSDTKICLMSRAVTEGSEQPKPKNSLRTVTQKLKRVFEGAQQLKDSSRAPTLLSSPVPQISLGCYPRIPRKISNLNLYQSSENDSSLLNSNIRMMESVQLKHSQTDANLLSSVRSNMVKVPIVSRSGTAAMTDRNWMQQQTDRDYRLTRKPNKQPPTPNTTDHSRDTLLKQPKVNYMR